MRAGRVSDGTQSIVAVQRDGEWFQVEAPDVSLLDVLATKPGTWHGVNRQVRRV